MNADADSVLVVKHLSLTFGAVVAVDDLSFVAQRHEITGLIGPKAAGKTAVLDCISGIRHPPTGRIELHSGGGATFLLERMDDYRIARDARVARMFHNPRLFAGLTVLENVLIAPNLRQRLADAVRPVFMPSIRRQQALYWLDRVGLSHFAQRMPGELPRALQRRVELARALASESHLICFDDPQGGLSRHEFCHLAARMRELGCERSTMLVTADDPEIAEMLCDRAVVLDRGVCIANGSPRQLRDDRFVRRAFLGVPGGGDTVPGLPVSC